MSDDFIQVRKNEVESNKILVYAKGKKGMPQCGFSAQVMEIFSRIGKPYEVINVLDNPDIRGRLKEFSGWPTFPQVFVGGKFIGGCDITTELYESGELEKIVAEVFE